MMSAKMANDLFHQIHANSVEKVYSHMATDFDDFVQDACADDRDYAIIGWSDFRASWGPETYYDDHFYREAAEPLIENLLELGYAIQFSYCNATGNLPTGLLICWGDNKDEDIYELAKQCEY